jgi:hypothetical protein
LTVSNQTSVVQYNGNGSTVAWPTGFRFFKNTDLVVTKRTATGVTTLLTLNTDYSVSGANSAGGGTVTTTNALAVGELLTVARVLTVQQLTDLRNQGEYFAEIHEDVFDYLTMLIQQANEVDSRALKHPRDSEHYQAEGRRIVDLESPVDPQDAATKSSVEEYVNSILETGEGPVNNAANVIYATGGGINRTVQARLRDFVMLTDFPGALTGAANSSAGAFAAAEASVYTRIFLPFGVWNAGATVLTKNYYGLGTLITNGSYRSQQYVNITTDPQKGTNPDFEFAATGDLSKVNAGRWNLGRIRNNLNEYYFNAPTTPFWNDMVSQAGHSGTSAKFINVLGVGTTVLNMVGPCPEITPGMPIRITDDIQGFNATCVTNIGNILTFTPGSPSVYTTPFTNGPTSTYGYVTRAIRTMNTLHMGNVEHQGGGDAYVFTGRIINNNKFAQASQNHFFEISTIGLFGGDLVNITPGGYMTGTEMNFADSNYQGSFQSSAFGHLVNLQRTADNGAYGGTWMGFVTKSEASQYADVAYKAFGKFKRGIDLVGVTFGADLAAITLPRTSRIYLDSSGIVKDSRGFNWWSDVPGGSWLGTGTAGDVQIVQGGLGRVIIEDDWTRIRAKVAGGHVVLDRGYLDLYTEVAATAGASQGYATIFIAGVARKIQIFAM